MLVTFLKKSIKLLLSASVMFLIAQSIVYTVKFLTITASVSDFSFTFVIDRNKFFHSYSFVCSILTVNILNM